MSEPNEKTKFYINQYGIFYEGQILHEYVCANDNWYYSNDIVIVSFFRRKRKNKLGFEFYFRFKDVDKTQIWSLKCSELGVRFKVK